MKRNYRKATFLIMASILAVSPLTALAEGESSQIATAGETTAEEYDYPNKYLWFEEAKSMTWNDYYNIYTHHNMWATDEFDIDSLVNSKQGEEMITGLKNFILYEDEMDPDVVAYWEEKGLKKELHDADTPESKWSTFTPLSAYEEGNEERKYPVIFVLHGNDNPIFIAETYGYTDVAAEQECIVVCPWADNNNTIDTEFFRILEELKKNYPIDESRIYLTGFSAGGTAAQELVKEHADLFAALVTGGSSIGALEEEQIEVIKESGIPVVTYSGLCDYNCPMLLYRDGRGGKEKNTSVTKCAGFSSWAEALGIDASLTSEEAMDIHENSEDEVKAMFGIDFDETEKITHNDTDYYIGRFYDENGVNRLTYLGVENCPHWSAGYTAQIIWDSISQYSRDTQTGEMKIAE